MMLDVLIVCAIGFVVAAYVYYYETKLEKDPSYRTIFDISEHISSAKHLGNKKMRLKPYIKNMVPMTIFLVLMMIFALLGYTYAAFGLALVMTFGTIFKQYNIVTKAKTFCIVCNTFFLVVYILLYLTYQHIA